MQFCNSNKQQLLNMQKESRPLLSSEMANLCNSYSNYHDFVEEILEKASHCAIPISRLFEIRISGMSSYIKLRDQNTRKSHKNIFQAK